MTGNVYFDSRLKTKTKGTIPYYDISFNVANCEDKKLMWFHEGYGMMRLYRIHQIDRSSDFIAELAGPICRTSSSEWTSYLENPEYAMKDYYK